MMTGSVVLHGAARRCVPSPSHALAEMSCVGDAIWQNGRTKPTEKVQQFQDALAARSAPSSVARMERSEIRDCRSRISALRASIRATSCLDTKVFIIGFALRQNKANGESAAILGADSPLAR